jgi:LacI family transcriptional regulator
VLLHCYADDQSLPFVVPDEIQGGSTLTETLLKNGHCRIGFISNSDPTPMTVSLFEGHRHALAAHGVRFDAKLVAAPSRTEGDGYRSTQVWMQQPARPTALFSTNDVLVMDAYAALQSLHLAIPNDGAVLGRDSPGMIADHLFPSLSTLERPHLATARWAADYLVEYAARELSGPRMHERYVARLSI